jgi:hypothetical protein
MADKSELRKHPRKHYGRPAWIDVGDGSPRLCMVYDLSETGVGIRLATDETLQPSSRFCSRELADPADGAAFFGRMGTGSVANL